MAAEMIMDEIAELNDWTTEEQLQAALEYIDNQGSDAAFRDFLERSADDDAFRDFLERRPG